MDSSDLYEIRSDPIFGKGWYAKVPIRKGTCLHTEDPLAYCTKPDDEFERCMTCLKPRAKLQCSSCKKTRYCSTVCQKGDWVGHKAECAGIKRAPINPGANLRIVGRLYRKYKNDLKAKVQLDALVTHMDKTPKRTLQDYQDMAELMAFISGYDPKGPIVHEFIALICKHSRNSYAIQDIELQSIGVALYPTISFINHSCNPNAFLCHEGPKASIIVYKDLKEGDQIFVSYVETLETREGRREALMEEYFFECRCDVCESKDPVDIREAIKCSSSNCQEILPQRTTVCSKCNTPVEPLSFGQLQFEVELATTELTQTSKMERMEKELRRRFPDTNVMLIQLWKSMIVAYLYEKNFDQAFLVSSDYMAALDKIYPTYHPTKSFLAYSMFLIAPNVTGVTGQEYFDVTKRALSMLVMTHGAGHVLSVEVGRAMDAFRERFPDALPS